MNLPQSNPPADGDPRRTGPSEGDQPNHHHSPEAGATPPGPLPAAGELSRQRRAQKRWKAAGLCVTCGQPRNGVSPAYCLTHLEYQRTAARNRYRIKHGIPLESPIAQGRPRKGAPSAPQFQP